MLVYTLLITFFFIEIFKALYPKDYDIIFNIAKKDYKTTRQFLEPKIIYVCYNLIYYYSCSEIYMNKLRGFIRPYIKLVFNKVRELLEKNNIIKPLDSSDKENQLLVEYFNNGILSYSFNFDILNDKMYLKECPTNYDFIVCSDFSDVTKPTNKLCISNSNLKNDYDFKYGLTNFNFMSLQLIYNNTNYSIELKNDKFNFYIVNNILDNTFFRYYLINILKEENITMDFFYTLELLDQNVDLHKLNEKNFIILNTDEFTIKSIDYVEEIIENSLLDN